MDRNRSSKPMSHSRKLLLEPVPADDVVGAARTAEQALIDRCPVPFDFLKQSSDTRVHFAAMVKITRKLKKT
ncbi:hypothetical protein PG989_005865 [Apiospora arundinis]